MGHPVLTVKLSSKIKLYCIVKTSNIQMWPCKNLLDIDKNIFEKVIWHLNIQQLFKRYIKQSQRNKKNSKHNIQGSN